MPAPDPHGITVEEQRNDWTVTAEIFLLSGRTQRLARARRILTNLRRDGWICRGCGDPIAEHRRADACYCCEGCRKDAARARRKLRAACRNGRDKS